MAFGSGQVVARAIGVLDVDTSAWSRGLRDASRELNTTAAKAKISGAAISKTGDASDETGKSMEGLGKSSKGASMGLVDVGKSASDTDKRMATLGKSTDKTSETMRRMSRTSRDASRDNDNLSKSIDRLTLATGGGVTQTAAFQHTVSMIKFPAMIAGAGMATQAIGALGAAAVATVAALAPLSGLVAAYPAAMAAGAQAMGVFKLAFAGVGDAMTAAAGSAEEFNEAIKDLTPAQQEFAKTYRNTIVPFRKELEKIASSNLLPGVEKGLKAAFTPALQKTIKGIVDETSKAFGVFAELAGKELGKPQWAKDLKTIGETNVNVFNQIGGAVLKLAPAIRNIIVVAGPMLEQLAAWFNQLSGSFADFIDKARRSGDLKRFFQETLDVVQTLGGIFKSLGSIIVGVFKAAKPLGDDILKGLNDELGKLADWVNSAAGQNKLKQYFEDARPLAKAVYDLVIAVAGVFLDLTQQKPGTGLTEFLNTLRTDLLPKIKTLVEDTTAALGPALLDTIEAIADVFIELGGSSGPIVIFVEALGKMAEAIGWLIQNVPGFKEFVITFGAFMAIVKAVKLTGVVTGISGLATSIGALNTTSPGLVAKAGPVAGLTALGGTSGKLTGMGGKLKGIATGMVGVGPLGLAVGAGLIAAAFGLKEVYDRSPEFRDAVGDLKDQLSGIGDAIGPALASLGPALADVVEGMSISLGGISAAVGAMAGVFGSIPGPVKEVVEWMWRLGNPIGQAITFFQYLDDAIRITKDALSGIGGAFSDAVSAISGAVGGAMSAAAAFGSAILEGIRNGISTIVSVVTGFMTRAVSAVTGAAGRAMTAAVKWGSNVLSGIRKGIGNVVSTVAGFLTRAVNAISGAAGRALGAARNVGQAVVNGIRGGISAVVSTITGVLGRAISAISGFAGRVFSAAKTAFGSIVRGAVSGLSGLGSALIRAIGDAFSRAATFITDKASDLADQLGDVLNPTNWFQTGGRVPMQRGARYGKDSVLAMLTPGEAVLTQDQIARVGGTEALRDAGVPGFNKGGKVLPGTSHDYPQKAVLNAYQIADLAYRKGWKNKDKQKEATQIVLGESTGAWWKHYTGGGKEDSWGGWQINRRAHPQVSVAKAQDPEYSTGYARRLFNQSGWQPWGAWTDGRSKQFAGRAAAAVTRHRKALENADKDKGGKQNPTTGGKNDGKDGKGNPPPVSVQVAPPTGGPLVSAVPGWPGSGTNWRTFYGTYYQEDRNHRYVAFQPSAQTYWRVGMGAPGKLLNVPDPLEDEPGPHIGPLGEAAVGHPFAFPKWQRWWGVDTYKPFTDMAKARGMGPKGLREWANSNQVAAALIGFTPFNLPEGGNKWPGQGKASDATGGKDKKDKGDKDKSGDAKNPGAQRWQRVQKAIKEVNRIDALGLSYTWGGGHGSGIPPAGGGFDCSGFVRRVLMAAGILKVQGNLVSSSFMAGGSAGMKGGSGKWLTTWVRPGSGRSGHVFLGFPGGRMAESGGSGGGNWMHRDTAGFVASHPVGYHEGGYVHGKGNKDTVPALLTPGEIVLNSKQQEKLLALLGPTHGRSLWRRLGIPWGRQGKDGVVRAHTGTQVHFHWFGEQNRWTKGEKQAFLDKAKKEGKDGQKILNENPWMLKVFAGTAKPQMPLIHGPPPAPPAAPAAPATPAPGADEEYLEAEEDLGGGDVGGGDVGGGDVGPSGPTAAEIEAQIQERIRREAEAIWSARSGFMSELASNIFTMTPGGLDLGSSALGGTTPSSAFPGAASTATQPIVINSNFSQVPDDPFVWLRHVGTAARFAMI